MLLVLSAACVLAWFLWSSGLFRETPASDARDRVRIVRGSEPVREPETDEIIVEPGEEAVARSERTAAPPPPGGAEKADMRSIPSGGGVRFEPVRDDAGLRGYRMSGVPDDLSNLGFREGDLLVRIDGRESASVPVEPGPGALLAPGIIVDVERDGREISWRLGPKPL
ncbi:hypothetical protein [Sphingomonas lenta]|uniref:Uncharacterized protein n=1 Tax=Sphingomonas lenta TaxID=1141887 RepID=A0A2A2SEM1_9SPHN|nr:hypothetical protein [Sphingomonas lenta]PAX07707.1 hypothetical protein CKY28_08685 [Sphingomonas lenta]